MACFVLCMWRVNVHIEPTRRSSKEQHSRQEPGGAGRSRLNHARGSDAVSCETRSLCPFEEAAPPFLPAHPPCLPSCAQSSGQGSRLETVPSEVGQ